MGLSDMVVPVHARASEVKEVLSGLGYEKFDGAYSNYGAINTEPKLPKLAKDLRTMIKTRRCACFGRLESLLRYGNSWLHFKV